MSEGNELGKAMLKANGVHASGISAEDREVLQRLLERDRKRVRRAKWAMAIAWTALVLVWVSAAIASQYETFARAAIGATWYVLWFVAIFLTIAYAVRAYLLRMSEFRTQMIEVVARLEAIDKSLSRLAEKNQA